MLKVKYIIKMPKIKYMDKISLLEIKLLDDKRKYFDETFTKIPKPIFEILKKECETEIQKLIEYGKFTRCWYGAYGGVGHPDQYIDMYEKKKDNDFNFMTYIEFAGNEFEFYISDIDIKYADKFSEYTDIINDIKQKLNNLWNNSLRDKAKLKNNYTDQKIV
jgi:hypothetical protein